MRNGSSVELARIKTMNATYAAPETLNPLLMAMKVLDRIMIESLNPKAKKRDEAIPIKGFTEPPSRLRKMGISLLVTLEDEKTSKETVVPLRIDENTLSVKFSHFSHEERSSWKGKQIHRISCRFLNNFTSAHRKIKNCLRTAWNRFMRKINVGARRARHRARKSQEGLHRMEHARIRCH